MKCQTGWIKKVESSLLGDMSTTSDMQMIPPDGRKEKGIKEPLGDGERGEWKSLTWLRDWTATIIIVLKNIFKLFCLIHNLILLPTLKSETNYSTWKILEVEKYFDIFFSFIFISWRLITLQYCSGFCHTLTWISHGFTCIPHPDPPSHLPLLLTLKLKMYFI